MNSRMKNIMRGIAHGKILLYLKVDKYLLHIIYFFIMAILFIWANLGIDSTLHRQEENKTVLENLKSLHTEFKCELTNLNSVCKVEEMLQNMDSKVDIPQKQAIKVE